MGRLAPIFLLAFFLIFGGCTQPSIYQEMPSNASKNFSIQNASTLNYTNVSSCPASCDDNDSKTFDFCNESTFFKCIHINIEQIIQNETQIQSNYSPQTAQNISETITTATQTNKSENLSIILLANESKEFIKLVNKKRLEFYSGKSLLSEDERLAVIAEECMRLVLMANSSNLSVCFDEWGSFRSLLEDIGFYGYRFFFLSIINNSPSTNLSQAFFDALPSKQKLLLTNTTIDHPSSTYPAIVDYIGVSAGCLNGRCALVAVTAGNRETWRIDYDNWDTFSVDFFSLPNKSFVPQHFSIKILEASEERPAWCKGFIYNLTNHSYIQATDLFWWSDQWEYANHGFNYEKRFDWTEYASETITKPSLLYFWCYSTKTLNEGPLCYSSYRDKVEFRREFLPTMNLTASHVRELLKTKAAQRKESNYTNQTILQHINSLRVKNNLSSLNYSNSLAFLAKSCAREFIKNLDFQDCRVKVFGNSSFSVLLGSRGMHGAWLYTSRLINEIDSEEFLLDTFHYSADIPEFVYGDFGKSLEYFGDGYICQDGVCASMLLFGSNKVYSEFTNVRKDCGWADKDCAYGYIFFRNYRQGCGRKIDISLWPNISLHFNSSVPALYYFYKNKYYAVDIFENGEPKEGYELRTYDYKKEFNITLPAGVWTVVYWPKVNSVYDKENFTLNVVYHPVIKIE
ncbi:MAG: hypothetical protein N3G80_00930 [Candidatus Micrarchaeota archaeon]|nr:hypothetical protein [Candidatus Micrarchaeota archaeon]